MLKLVIRSLPIILSMFVLMPFVVFGQNTDELCRLFVNRAFREIGDNCSNLGEAEACYAYGDSGEVASTFYIDGQPRIVREDVFTHPAERVSILDDEQRETLESMNNEKFVLDVNGDDIEEDQWGVSFQMVRGNLPRQLEQDEAVYIVFGGARIENGIYPEDALVLPENPLFLTTQDNTTVYGSPVGLGYLVPADEVGVVSGVVEADSISADGNWVRIFYLYQREYGQRATAWIQVSDLVASQGLEVLPIIDPDTYTAMQRLFLSNIFEDPTCENVIPPGIIVQGPSSIEFDFSINNLPSRVTSTAYYEQIAPRRMRITTLSGFTVLWPDSGNEVVIPAGYFRVVCLTPLLDLGIDGQQNDRELDNDCGEGGTGVLSRSDLDRLQGFRGLPESVLNYPLGEIPEQVCASGVGGARCTLQISPDNLLYVQLRCDDGTMTSDVCEQYGIIQDLISDTNIVTFADSIQASVITTQTDNTGTEDNLADDRVDVPTVETTPTKIGDGSNP